MKVYFGTCGIGLAHTSRMLPIADRLRERGIEVVFSTYGKASELVTRNNYELLRAPNIGWREKGGELDIKRTLVASAVEGLHFVQQYLFEKYALKKFKPDLVISDSRYTTLLASAKLKIPVLYIANQIRIVAFEIPFKEQLGNLISNFNYLILRRCAAEVIAPDLPEPYTIGKENLNTDKLKINFVGPIVRERPESLPSQVILKERLGFETNKILVYIPISGPGSSRLNSFNLIMHAIKNLSKEINFVVVKGDPGGSYEERIGNILIKDWAENRASLLKACDLVISRCGHGTISEIVVYGKPSILIPQPNQPEQYVNARGCESLGIGKVIEQNKLDSESLYSATMELTSNEKVNEKLKKLQELSKEYDGTKRILERVLEFK
ncbi:MAG: UDP-N-acetylglucosamine--N-acetylmuramyl-(pentapeptide) pyrophosphoryl-undecaprenol N-acetylglucosamine transferase [Candidatus Thermoplasmatota archaeon]|nr:UDP-N-acetylglucosamine--N-acetylmuramyl-(pentapeptide) pyrophosphoryl-undecaprenol N-acetylglucosamine transferase [Candidatus Thermoplasmatota archaeon]